MLSPGREATRSRPEAVLASKAEQRLSSRDGRPLTNQSSSSKHSRPSTNQNPSSRHGRATHQKTRVVQGSSTPSKVTTPGKLEIPTGGDESLPENIPSNQQGANEQINPEGTVTNQPGGAPHSGSDTQYNGSLADDPGPELILEEDELFMVLTDEERKEWDLMMEQRVKKMEECVNSHQTWADNFTRRRMFALSRMRKLNLCYPERLKAFNVIADNIKILSSPRKTTQLVPRQKTQLTAGQSATQSPTDKENRAV